ncbi:Coiled-coil domain-containing protein 40 [Portunus trituberculatus]|uniref:Coiled-coil domain-containing protein 40 n=1 Tax=Portunus trituberculatus TaxID=210409 RepID=A0A5B7CZE9_PORTR|nr:Coiled-coil domain-containing protein 40 [Portunus trituberculatus]
MDELEGEQREDEGSDAGVVLSDGEEEGERSEGWETDRQGEGAPNTPPPPRESPPPAIPTQQQQPSPPVSPPASPRDPASPEDPAGFQEAKRRQLQEEKSQLQLRFMQLRQQTSDLKRENVMLGSKMFEVQQAVTRAQVNLDKSKTERRRTRELLSTARESVTTALRQEQEVVAALTAARRHEVDMKREVERLGVRVAVMKTARANSEGDVTTLTRVLHKTAWDRAALEKDKLLQDLLVERLTAALERETTTIRTLQEAKREEMELAHALRERARLQEEELLHLECEGVGVKRAWESNVVVLQRRSEEHSQAQEHLQQLAAERSGLKAQLHNTRKEVRQNQLEHEQQSCRLLRMERDVTKQREKLSEETQEQERMIERAYNDIRITTERWRRIEDQALARLAHHTAATRAARNLRRSVADARARCRQLAGGRFEERSRKDQWKRVCRGSPQQTAGQGDRAGTGESLLFHAVIDILEMVASAAAPLFEAPPADREERRLRLLLQDHTKERAALEDEALSVHRHLLEARDERDILTEKISRLQQELGALRGRQARLESGVHQERSAFKEAERRRERLHRALATVDSRLHQEAQLREATSREADASETQLLAKLHEMEQKAAKRDNELEELKDKREEIEGTLLEATKERTQWEKSLAELRDIQETLKKDMGTEGDLHAMKTEITRMQARWRTLQATQKELSGQLEQSVSVEAALKTRTLATVSKLRRDPNGARATTLMHEDILKRKLTKNTKKLSEIESAVGAARDERNRLGEEGQRQERLYAHNVRLLQEAATHLEQKLVKKQEEQLRLQECRARLRHLTAVREGRYKMLAAAGEEAQQAVKERLAARAQAYGGVVAQLEAGFPNMEVKLRNMKILLQKFVE